MKIFIHISCLTMVDNEHNYMSIIQMFFYSILCFGFFNITITTCNLVNFNADKFLY